MLPNPRRFETDSRYYVVTCERDLFGELRISRYWGNKGNRQGQQHHEIVSSYEKLEKRLAVITQQRTRDGYVEVAF